MNFLHSLTDTLEEMMFGFSQLFLIPVLVIIFIIFLYAFYALGAFVWQAWQRRRGSASAFELQALRHANPGLGAEQLEAHAVIRLEAVRLVSRIAPLLGLVATMIPMGPALKALGDGKMADVANSLMLAFSAVILSLLSSAITFLIANVRKRWYAQELLSINSSSPAPGGQS